MIDIQQAAPTAQAAPASVLHLAHSAFAEIAMAFPKAYALHKVGIADTAVREALAAPAAQADSQPAPDEIINMAREQGLPETETEGVFIVNADDLGRIFASYRAARAPADSDLITIRKPTTSAEMLWLLKLAHLVISDVDKTLEESFATAQPAAQQGAAYAALPEGWAALTITHEGQYPEEVAYGPQIMMDRLGKWLAKYFAQTAQADSVTAPAAGAVAGPGRKCMGPRCMASTENGYAHSRECIDEAGEVQGWKPTAEDYATCGPSAPIPPAQTADSVPPPAEATNTKTHELLSTTVGLLMGYREGAARQPYKPGSVIAKVVYEVVDHLKDWPYPEPIPPAQAADSVLYASDAVHQIKLHVDSEATWRDATRDTYDMHPPSTRRILYAARKQGATQ